MAEGFVLCAACGVGVRSCHSVEHLGGAGGVGGVPDCIRFGAACLGFFAYTGVGCFTAAVTAMEGEEGGTLAEGPSARLPSWTTMFPYRLRFTVAEGTSGRGTTRPAA